MVTEFKGGQELTEEEVSKVAGGYSTDHCPWSTRAIYIGDTDSLYRHKLIIVFLDLIRVTNETIFARNIQN